MKGLSVVASILLLLVAHYLAAGLRRAGALPSKTSPPAFLPGASQSDTAQAGGNRVYRL